MKINTVYIESHEYFRSQSAMYYLVRQGVCLKANKSSPSMHLQYSNILNKHDWLVGMSIYIIVVDKNLVIIWSLLKRVCLKAIKLVEITTINRSQNCANLKRKIQT